MCAWSLDAEVQEGTATAAKYCLPRLIALVLALPPEKRPQLVRGDNAFGNEPVMRELEAIGQPTCSNCAKRAVSNNSSNASGQARIGRRLAKDFRARKRSLRYRAGAVPAGRSKETSPLSPRPANAPNAKPACNLPNRSRR